MQLSNNKVFLYASKTITNEAGHWSGPLYIESVNVSLHGYKYLGVKHNINLGSFAVIPDDVLRFKHLPLFAPFRRHKCGIMLTRVTFFLFYRSRGD